MRFVIAFALFLSSAHSDDLVATDLHEIECGEPYGYLDSLMMSSTNRGAKQHFEHVWLDSDEPHLLGPPDDDGWREVHFRFMETAMERGDDGLPAAVKPWRKWSTVGRVRVRNGHCELADLRFERDWVADVMDHVVDKCFRFYAAWSGLRSERQIVTAIDRLKRANRAWMTQTVINVRDDPLMQQRRSGRALALAYGQHVLQCQADIENGRLRFADPG